MFRSANMTCYSIQIALLRTQNGATPTMVGNAQRAGQLRGVALLSLLLSLAASSLAAVPSARGAHMGLHDNWGHGAATGVVWSCSQDACTSADEAKCTGTGTRSHEAGDIILSATYVRALLFVSAKACA